MTAIAIMYGIGFAFAAVFALCMGKAAARGDRWTP